MKKLLAIFLALSMMVAMLVVPVAAVEEVEPANAETTAPIYALGSEDYPISEDNTVTIDGVVYTVVSTVAEFEAMAGENNYILKNDIDFGQKKYDGIAIVTNAIQGIVEGNGYSITGFNVKGLSVFNTYDNGTNLTLRNITAGAWGTYNGDGWILVTPTNNDGSAVWAYRTKGATVSFENVTTYFNRWESSELNCVGGFVGQLEGGNVSFKNCSAYGSIVANTKGYKIGAFVANAESGTLSFENCKNGMERLFVKGGFKYYDYQSTSGSGFSYFTIGSTNAENTNITKFENVVIESVTPQIDRNAWVKIKSVADLKAMSGLNNYILQNDIDFGGAVFDGPIVKNPWIGTLYGEGYSLLNYSFSTGTNNGTFDFCSRHSQVTIKDLTFGAPETPINVAQDTDDNGAGVIAGRLGQQSVVNIENCEVYGNVTSTDGKAQLGLFVGTIHEEYNGATLTITDSTANGIVSGANKVGGFLGNNDHNYPVTLNNCTNNATVSATTENVGGLVGITQGQGEISLISCTNNGNVICTGTSINYGAYIGKIDSPCTKATVSNCTNNVDLPMFGLISIPASRIDYTVEDCEYFNLANNWADAVGVEVKCGTETYNYTSFGLKENAMQTLLGTNMAVGSTLDANFYALLDSTHASAQVRFTIDDETFVVDGVQNATTGEYVFTMTGVAPQLMGETVTAELILGEEVLDTKNTFSVKSYLEALVAANPTDAKLATLVADMLTYGAAAQEYTAFKMDALVNAGVTGATEFVPLTSDSALTLETAEGVTLGGTKLTAVNAWFDSTNRLIVKYTVADGETAIVSVDGVAVEGKLVEGTENTYAVEIAVSALNFNKDYVITLHIDGAETDTLVQTLTYSVEAYVYATQDDARIGALVKALYNYGLSAVAYNNAK